MHGHVWQFAVELVVQIWQKEQISSGVPEHVVRGNLKEQNLSETLFFWQQLLRLLIEGG